MKHLARRYAHACSASGIVAYSVSQPMDILKMLSELRSERSQIEEAIRFLNASPEARANVAEDHQSGWLKLTASGQGRLKLQRREPSAQRLKTHGGGATKGLGGRW